MLTVQERLIRNLYDLNHDFSFVQRLMSLDHTFMLGEFVRASLQNTCPPEKSLEFLYLGTWYEMDCEIHDLGFVPCTRYRELGNTYLSKKRESLMSGREYTDPNGTTLTIHALHYQVTTDKDRISIKDVRFEVPDVYLYDGDVFGKMYTPTSSIDFVDRHSYEVQTSFDSDYAIDDTFSDLNEFASIA